MTFKKSWTAYLRLALAILFWIVVLILVYAYQDAAVTWAFRENVGLQTVLIVWLIAKVLIVLRIARLLYNMAWLRTFVITVGDDLVSVRHGILPWTKFQRHWDSDQMHECLVRQSGFFGWLFGTGDVIIVGTEGSTHKYTMPAIGRAEKACGAINTMRRVARTQKRRA